MKISTFLYYILFIPLLISCSHEIKPNQEILFAESQLKLFLEEVERASTANKGLVSPRSLREDTLYMTPSKDWTSGFFPGNLWHMYELSRNEVWLKKAREFTAKLEGEKTNKKTHDLGFMMYNSFGNGYRITKDPYYKEVLLQSAQSLLSRYDENVGTIRSWDHHKDQWQYPVIIDNMMNLELLFWATKITGDSSYYKAAVKHADATLRHHFREDNSSYHVVDYDTLTGAVLNRHTHQGFAHESAWARGQAWGLYGYTMAYRETGLTRYLDKAEKIALFILEHPNLPDDLVPYWDFNAPNIPDAPRDASAAAITASALLELSTFDVEKRDFYKEKATQILQNLTNNYRSKTGDNKGFILHSSTGHLPGKHEINVPLIYADYYYLEALKKSIEN